MAKKPLFKKLCNAELDRVTAAEICIDELLTICDRHDEDGPIYNLLVNLSAWLSDELSDADGSQKRRERLVRIRNKLTDAMPLSDADLAAGRAMLSTLSIGEGK